jgi:hypothetical protein
MKDLITIDPKLRVRLDEVRGALDELRLKLRLAGMELRDSWEAFTPTLSQLEHRLGAAGREAVVEIGTALDKAGSALKKMGDELRKPS